MLNILEILQAYLTPERVFILLGSLLGTIIVTTTKELWKKRKKNLRDRRIGDFTNHVYFLTAENHQKFIGRYVAPDNNAFYTIIIKLYHRAIIENFNGFAQILISEDLFKMKRKHQIDEIYKKYRFFSNRIIFDTNNLNIPEPLFSAIRKETMQAVQITEIGIMEILDSNKFKELTNKELSSMILRELRKFLMHSEAHIIPAQGRLNGTYKGLVFNHKGKEFINE